MKKTLKFLSILLNLAISAVCILLINRLIFTYDSLIEPCAVLLLLIALKNCVEVFLTA